MDHGLAAELPERNPDLCQIHSQEQANAKIAVLYQNDDYGKDYLKGLKDGLGANASMIVAEESYETTEPTIDSHIVKLKASGADVFVNLSIPKFAAQAIKKNAEIEWKPLHFLNSVSSSIGATIKPAGFESRSEHISSTYLRFAEVRVEHLVLVDGDLAHRQKSLKRSGASPV